MGTWKEILTRTGIILLAAAVVFGLSLPLAQSDWADGLRSDPGGEQIGVEQAGGEMGEPIPEGERSGPEGEPTGLMTVLPFVKVLVMMGIPGLITGAVLWLTRRTRRARHRSQLVPA